MAVAHAESFAGGASPCAPYRLPGLPARAGRSVRSPPSAAKPRHHNIVHGMPSLAPRRWRGGAMGTSRPTATGHEGGAPRCRPGGAHGHGARAVRGEGTRKMRAPRRGCNVDAHRACEFCVCNGGRARTAVAHRLCGFGGTLDRTMLQSCACHTRSRRKPRKGVYSVDGNEG